ncbi:hypothetical protein ACFLXU_00885 [Chloroflexota bacterium]
MGIKYDKYVHPVTHAFKTPMRNIASIDADTFPMMTHHLEAITYHHPGSVYIPGKPMPLNYNEYNSPDYKGLRYGFDLLPSSRSPMLHTYDEYFFFVGTNPDDPNDLGGELDFWLGAGQYAERQYINKPTCIYVPAGMTHCPIDVHRVDRPFIELVVAPRPTHTEFHPGLWPTGYEPPYPEGKPFKALNNVKPADTHIYSKYVTEIKSRRPAGPMRNGLVSDADENPIFTYHLEALFYHHPGSFYLPTNKMTLTMEEYKSPDYKGLRYPFDVIPKARSPMFHTYEEMFFFVGTNPDDPNDLGGELDFWLGTGEHAEKQFINKPCCIYVPAGMTHCPIDVHKVNRPFYEFVIVPNPVHYEFHPGLWPTGYKPPYPEGLKK